MTRGNRRRDPFRCDLFPPGRNRIFPQTNILTHGRPLEVIGWARSGTLILKQRAFHRIDIALTKLFDDIGLRAEAIKRVISTLYNVELTGNP
jgi:hypothetical protein